MSTPLVVNILLLLLDHIWRGSFCKNDHVMFTAVGPCCHVTLGRSIDFLVKCFFLATRTFYFFVLPAPPPSPIDQFENRTKVTAMISLQRVPIFV